MATMTYFMAGALINGTLRNTAYTPAATVYVALFTAAPTAAYTSGSPNGTEVSGNGYARQSATFGAPASGVSSTTANITFPADVTSNWGTVTTVGIFDALTTGNLLYFGPLTASQVVNVGNTFQIPSGQLSLTLS